MLTGVRYGHCFHAQRPGAEPHRQSGRKDSRREQEPWGRRHIRWRANARTAPAPLKAAMAEIAASTVVEQVNADVTLVSKDLTTALQEVITQMAGAGTIYAPDYYATANACTAGTPTANAANTGTGVLVASVVRPDGRTSEHVYAENLEAVCTTDAQPGGGANSGGTARQETFTLR